MAKYTEVLDLVDLLVAVARSESFAAYYSGKYWGRHIPPRGFRDAQEVALARRVSVYRLRCLLGHQHLDGG